MKNQKEPIQKNTKIRNRGSYIINKNINNNPKNKKYKRKYEK